MRILIVGNKGNMGQRYTAICRSLGHEVLGFDLGDNLAYLRSVHDETEIDRAIIATPTDSHSDWCHRMVEMKIPFLCEKPVSKNIEDVKKIALACEESGVDGRVVCNWTFTYPGGHFQNTTKYVLYNCWKTGPEGLPWDAWQLFGIIDDYKNLHIKRKSPEFRACIGGSFVSLTDIDRSYVSMIIMWIQNCRVLWSIGDAVKITQKVLGYIEWKKNDSN